MAGPRFVRDSLLGSGGKGEVWKAWDNRLGRWVALKFLKAADDRDLVRLRGEAHVAATLVHPHIVAIHDIGEEEGLPFVAMQFVEGRTLDEVGSLGPRRAAELVRDAARAVAYAHGRGIVHHDLNPRNLKVTKGGHLYVLDFGFAAETRSESADFGGTTDGRSPEQLTGSPPNPKNDIRALGTTLRDVLAGERARVPGRLAVVVSKCLSGQYGTAAELAEDLDRFLVRRRRLGAAAVAAVILLTGAGTTAMVFERHQQVATEALTWSRLGERKLQDQDDEGAAAAFTRSIDLRPESRTYLFRSFAYWRLCDFPAALRDTESALELEPSNEAAKRCRDQVRKAMAAR